MQIAATRLFLLFAKEDAPYASTLAHDLANQTTNAERMEIMLLSEPALLMTVGVGTQPGDVVIALLSPSALQQGWFRSQMEVIVARQGHVRTLIWSAQPTPSALLPHDWLIYSLPAERPEVTVLPAEAASRTLSLLSDPSITAASGSALRPDVPPSGPIAAQNAPTIPSNPLNTPALGMGAIGLYSPTPYPPIPYPPVAPSQRGFGVWTFIGATVLATTIIVTLLFVSGVFRVPRTPLAPSLGQTQATATPYPASTSTVVTHGQQLFAADWSLGLSGWSVTGDWQIVDGALMSNCVSKCTILAPFTAGNATANYTVDAEIAVVSINNSDGFFGPIARVQGDASQAEGYIGGLAGLNGAEISGIPQLSYIGGGTLGAPGAPIVVGNGMHEYRLEVLGSQISLFVDGTLEAQVADYTFPSGGRIGLRASPDVQIRVNSLTVTAV